MQNFGANFAQTMIGALQAGQAARQAQQQQAQEEEDRKVQKELLKAQQQRLNLQDLLAARELRKQQQSEAEGAWRGVGAGIPTQDVLPKLGSPFAGGMAPAPAMFDPSWQALNAPRKVEGIQAPEGLEAFNMPDVQKPTLFQELLAQREQAMAAEKAKAMAEAEAEAKKVRTFAEQDRIRTENDMRVADRTAANRPPKEAPTLTPNQQLELMQKFRKEVGVYDQATSRVKRATAAAQQATNFADMSLVRDLILAMDDPNNPSVVREGEVQMAEQAQSVKDRLRSYLPKLQGKGTLSPDAREEIIDLMKLYQGIADESKQLVIRDYTDAATNYGIDPKRVLGRYADAPQASGKPAPQAEAPPRGKVASQSEVSEYALAKKIPYAKAKQALEAQGYTVR